MDLEFETLRLLTQFGIGKEIAEDNLEFQEVLIKIIIINTFKEVLRNLITPFGIGITTPIH